MKRVSKPISVTELIVTVFFVVGGLFGCIFACKTDIGDLRTSVSGYLDGFTVGYRPIYLFFTNVLTHLRYPLILFVFSFSIAGVVVIPAAIFLKGYALSYAFSALIRVLGTNGYLSAFLMFGFQGIFMLSFLYLAGAVGLRMALNSMRMHYIPFKTNRAVDFTQNHRGLIACLAVSMFAACISSLLDTYVTPYLLTFFSIL